MRCHLLVATLLLAVACGGSTDSDLGTTSAGGSSGSAGSSSGSGGSAGTSNGGTSASGNGGTSAGSGNTAGNGVSGSNNGGTSASGNGGTSAGGTSNGGSNVGGTSNGGSNVGGTSNGGSNVGGTNNGGTNVGGTSNGGTSNGGSNVGGTSNGGTGGINVGGAGGAPTCAGPVDPNKAAVCVTFLPETITPVPGDAQLDRKGLMVLEAFDTPFPDGGPTPGDNVPALATAIYPPISGPNPEVTDVLQVPTLRLDGLPGTVYLRALFFDNLDALDQKQISWGVWIGGMDLQNGLKDESPIGKSTLVAGQASSLSMPLIALRRLDVTVKLASNVQPLDNAEGPLQWFSFNSENLVENAPLFGLSPASCLSLAGGKTTVSSGFVFGKGDHYIVGNLNDYNTTGDFKGGEILNLEASQTALKVLGGKVNNGDGKQYRLEHKIDLSLVIPLPINTPNPASYSCP